jgi:hypothetical protein
MWKEEGKGVFFFEFLFFIVEWLGGLGFFFKNMLKGDGKGRGFFFFLNLFLGC